MPGTLNNDQFGTTTVAEALDVLARCSPRIEAIGVTDYYTTGSYRRALAAQQQGSGDTTCYLFPNVEIRLDSSTDRHHPINVHLLCAPEDVDDLDDFVGSLEFSGYRGDEAGLRRLGRSMRTGQTIDDQTSLRLGSEQFKVGFEDLIKRIETSKWARRRCLVAVPGGNDGPSGQRDGGFDRRRRDIYRMAHLVFSGRPKDAEFWSGSAAASAVEIEEQFGALKPCLHGCDSHKVAELGLPRMPERLTWLKGDATFETLRLACLSPSTRVRIDRESPAETERGGRVTQLAVNDTKWFTVGSVPINSGLVAVIGARGSGKTALADLIAAAAGSTEPFENDSSFVSRADRLLDNTVATATWSDSSTSVLHFAERHQSPSRNGRVVRYLSQQFVERLCSARTGVTDELVREIERVVFESLPSEDREGAEDFDSLLNARLLASRLRQEEHQHEIEYLSNEIAELNKRKASWPRLEVELGAVRSKRSDAETQQKALLKKADQQFAGRLHLIEKILAERNDRLDFTSRQTSALTTLESFIGTRRTNVFDRDLEKAKSEHLSAGLSDDEWSAFRLTFAGDVDAVIAEAKRRNDQLTQTLRGTTVSGRDVSVVPDDDLAMLSLNELATEKARLTKLVGLDASREQRLTQVNRELADLDKQIASRQQTLGSSDEVEQRISRTRELRYEHYESYFDALLEEEQELNRLYEPLNELVAAKEGSLAKLQLSIRRTVELKSWASVGEAYLDSRTAGAFQGIGALAEIASAKLQPAWQQGDGKAAAAALKSFSNEHSKDFRAQMKVDRNDPEAVAEMEQLISAWLYSASHVKLSYGMHYSGLELERLSPGLRGIVLLLLYLAIDQHETDPLIIDQPEENLDPESVYTELVDLFRRASDRRQIIMVTHNANLVVNSDVDQVIVARCDTLKPNQLPELEYVSGGLENPQIRQLVCEVLEGGTKAFQDRARRLDITVSPD